MTEFTIRHKTTYRYRQLVTLGSHRLMLRPRESCNLRVITVDIAVTPSAPLKWAHDVFGNAVATVAFAAPTDSLIVESHVELVHQAEAWPVFDIATSAISFPFSYSDDERLDLGALLVPQHEDPQGRLLNWVRGFVRSNPTDTLSLLKDVNAAISAWISYQSRDDEGTQSPLATLDRGWGSCRDLALLLVEAVRRLGFGARIVSGYLVNQDDKLYPLLGSMGAGSTHAWAEIYLPGAGWITFDPTNRTVGDFSLIPVAVARDIKQVVPVSGSFIGSPADFLGMSVEVAVRPGAVPRAGILHHPPEIA
jgi:transglutaminase-like putative cysteine protease